MLESRLVWPKPPETARIRYVGALSTETDLKRGVSWSEGFGQLIFGKKRIGVMLAPYAVAIDENDRLFVSDATAAVVHMFDLNTRRYKQFADIKGEEKLRKPVGIAIAGKRVYVVDSALHKVCAFNKDGKFIFSFGEERLKRPCGIAYLEAEGKTYVADAAKHVVDIFAKDGEFMYQIGSRGLQAGMFNFPTHLWIDRQGYLYVSDTLNYRIQVFTKEGKFVRMFGSQGDRPGNFAHPCGVATDSYGRIYVTDRQFENAQIFDGEGRILMAFGEEGRESGQFWLPAGICIDNRNRIYIADSFNKRVQIFELLEKANNEE
jgi:DNA-binding beta-propeller fold protein YncE